MIRKLPGIVVVCGLLIAAGCGKAEFQEYSNAEGKYKVQFPGKPKEQTQTQMGITMKIAGVEERNGAYMVMFSPNMPIPPNEPPAMIQNRLEGAIQGMMATNGGTVTSKNAITVNGKYPGRDFQASISRPMSGVLRGKIFLVGTRLYQIIVLGNSSFSNSADATKFLDSFTLND